MNNGLFVGKKALINGGTSGLGKSLAKQLKKQGCDVYVMGTNGYGVNHDGLHFMPCNLASLQSVINFTADLAKSNLVFDILINNAGILSPPIYKETIDGFEVSYQVNFLSHVLLTRLLLKNGLLQEPEIINTSSPIYVRGKLDLQAYSPDSYNLIKAYADSKLFLALFSEQLAKEGIRGFAFNPGTFSSGIYRSQNKWFHNIYKLAAPFMISADSVAAKVMKILETGKYTSGTIISKNGAESSIRKFDEHLKKEFWDKINHQLDRYF